MHLGQRSAGDRQVLVGYLYGELEYPSFQTTGEYHGKTLLQSTDGLVAGENKHGAGRVLLVNLPLGYLTTRTDGMLLHSFLHYFAEDMLQMPHLANVPDGVGGVVMNWHFGAAWKSTCLGYALAGAAQHSCLLLCRGLRHGSNPRLSGCRARWRQDLGVPDSPFWN